MDQFVPQWYLVKMKVELVTEKYRSPLWWVCCQGERVDSGTRDRLASSRVNNNKRGKENGQPRPSEATLSER